MAFSGCGESSSSASKSNGGDDDSPPGGEGGSGASGGTQGGSPGGGTAGSGVDPGGAGGTDAGGSAGVGGRATGGLAGSGGVAGSGAVAGKGGTAGAAGMAGAGGASTDPCVNVSGAGPEPWFELTVAGTGYNAEEGERMRVAVATASPNRFGIGEVSVVDGAFSVSIPEVLNNDFYVGITLYVDRNDNDACETDEHVWDFATRAVAGDMRFDVTPERACDNFGACRTWRPTQAACHVGSNTDLTEPLPCSP